MPKLLLFIYHKKNDWAWWQQITKECRLCWKVGEAYPSITVHCETQYIDFLLEIIIWKEKLIKSAPGSASNFQFHDLSVRAVQL